MDEVKCSGCDKESDSCRCQELVCAFNKTNQYLYNMQLLDRLAGYTLTNLIQERISTHVQDTCKGIFDISHIGSLLQWLDTIVLNWLTRIYNQGSLRVDPQNSRIRKVLKEFRIKLEYFLYDTYAHIIIEQFFNIIIGEFGTEPKQESNGKLISISNLQISPILGQPSMILKYAWRRSICAISSSNRSKNR